jgi:AmmeMemoRadiSam system protein B/AmmeMemoRadiSam system protein A
MFDHNDLAHTRYYTTIYDPTANTFFLDRISKQLYSALKSEVLSMKETALILLFAVLIISVCEQAGTTTLRKPSVAGAFYPSDRSELEGMVKEHLNAVADLPELDGQLVALIVPHAGLVYSGRIAAYAYKLLEGSQIDKIILCGPSHRYGFQGVSVYGPDIVWQTPLGNVRCDDSLCFRLLRAHKEINFIPEAHAKEHSLEVQLPYLQTVLKDFKIAPVAIAYQDKKNIDILADALKSVDFDGKTIMIASTDWQHYRPASVGWKMDSLGIECLRSLDPVRLEKNLQEGKVEMCGGGAAAAVMRAAIAKGADKVKILKYGDSGDLDGSKDKVVGYVAAAIYISSEKLQSRGEKKSIGRKDEEQLPKKFSLTESEKKELLQIARKTIEGYLNTGAIPDFDVSDNLKKFGAAFVTLEKGGQLRGCIGNTSAVEPLYKTVSNMAVQAAVNDRRFRPVQKEELADIDIEISVLTPMQKVESWDDIEVGRDGLMIFKGGNRGLLLPQVAEEYGWDKYTFLEQTCGKAGLPRNAYKEPDAVIYKFQAVIFREQP